MEEILKQLLEGQKQLFEGQKQLFEGQKQLFAGQQQLFEGQKQITQRLDNLEKGQQELNQDLSEVKTTVNNIEGQTRENTDFIQALIARTDHIAATVDGQAIASAKALGETNKSIDRIAGDITFLVRKAAEHDDDIRQLRKAE